MGAKSDSIHHQEKRMNMPRRFTLSGAALTAALALGGAAAQAQTKELTFAHQDMLVPLRLVMESGEVEKATGYKINWRMFSGGGDVIRAMASGDVQWARRVPAR
jgi:taurine transport system substrate-binding protein